MMTSYPKRRNWKFLDTSIHIIHYLCMVILIITYIWKEVTTIERGRNILMVTPIEHTSLGQTHHLNIPDYSRIVPHTIRECKIMLFLYCLPNTLITFPFTLAQICYISSVWNKQNLVYSYIMPLENDSNGSSQNLISHRMIIYFNVSGPFMEHMVGHNVYNDLIIVGLGHRIRYYKAKLWKKVL